MNTFFSLFCYLFADETGKWGLGCQFLLSNLYLLPFIQRRKSEWRFL